MPITIPALRELREDILPLADYFLNTISQKQGKKIQGFTPAAQHAMLNYAWPGNIRELINQVERSVILCQTNWIDAPDLGLPSSAVASHARPPIEGDLGSLEDMEKEHIRKVIEATKSNLSRTAEILGITRSTLYSKIRRYKLES